MYRIEFQVTGIGDFPYQMLSFEECFPASLGDAYKLTEKYIRRTIRLQKICIKKLDTIDFDRWDSVYWRVVDRKIRVVGRI